MRIKLTEIPTNGCSIKLQLSPLSIDCSFSEEVLIDKISFRGYLKPYFKEGFSLKGKLTGRWELTCSRCLCRFPYEVTHEFISIFHRNFNRLSPYNSTIDLKLHELDFSEISNNYIDLKHVLLEQMILQIPIKPLCSVGCLGLCLTCGENLNVSKCTCKPQRDPRFSKLDALMETLRKEK